jgi:hypothetical protein
MEPSQAFKRKLDTLRKAIAGLRDLSNIELALFDNVVTDGLKNGSKSLSIVRNFFGKR